MRVRYTPVARTDIDDIYLTIARNNPVAALQVEDNVREQAEGLSRFPGIGAGTDLEDGRRLPLVR